VTIIHDVSTFLFILVLAIHIILVAVLKTHWPNLFAWVKGTVSKDFVEEHHPVWYEEIVSGKKRPYKLFGYKEDR
jgi:cytochrome b subunit of formate dehydrogenase